VGVLAASAGVVPASAGVFASRSQGAAGRCAGSADGRPCRWQRVARCWHTPGRLFATRIPAASPPTPRTATPQAPATTSRQPRARAHVD